MPCVKIHIPGNRAATNPATSSVSSSAATPAAPASSSSASSTGSDASTHSCTASRFRKYELPDPVNPACTAARTTRSCAATSSRPANRATATNRPRCKRTTPAATARSTTPLSTGRSAAERRLRDPPSSRSSPVSRACTRCRASASRRFPVAVTARPGATQNPPARAASASPKTTAPPPAVPRPRAVAPG